METSVTRDSGINKKMLIVGAMIVSLFIALIFLGTNPIANAKVYALLQAAGIANPPNWLVWTLVGLASVSAVVAVVAAFGIASIPAWIAKGLAVADSFAA